jgi:ABC-type dipeptide/oligopeptide/nickel transport system permease subunit
MLAIYPGAMIFLTVIACNLLGDALLRRFDPRDPARG